MPDFAKGKIYVIRSNQTDNVYIGSTCKSLCARFRCHRSNYKLYREGKYGNCSSFSVVEYADAYIELIEKYPCQSKKQLLIREGEIIRKTENSVNKYVAGRTSAERYQENRERIKSQHRDYYERNKDQ